MELSLDLRGRLRNFRLPASRALVPVFEAIINASHAIDASGRDAGSITIEILRGTQQTIATVREADAREPISGFKIMDDGVGFNEDNFHSFCTSDSTYKFQIGGRGVGRFTWLKAFSAIRIDSIYRGPDGALRRRLFTFTPDGITELAQPLSAYGPEGTTVTLDGIGRDFGRALPKRASTIGQRIAEHCLLAFRAASAKIAIKVIDDADDSFDVRAEIERMMATAQTDQIRIADHDFRVTHLRATSPEVTSHRLAFLANGREVRSESLTTSIPQLRTKLVDGDNEPFWWVSLVEADILNMSINPERDGFLFPDEPDELFPDGLSIKGLREGVLPVVKKRLDDLLEPIRQRTSEHVRHFVETRAPEYRHLFAMRPRDIASLPPDLPEDKLDSALHRISYQIDAEIREEGRRLMSTATPAPDDLDRFVSDANVAGKANLAKYVLQRRIILGLLKKALERGENGNYQLEEAVHRMIFPLRKTSDEVRYEDQNLWIIDERLAYHAYLASDKELRSVAPLDSSDRQRPDLLIFNRPIALAEQSPISTIVIIEFKRPARDDYNDEDNPIVQVYDYIRRIRSGIEKDRVGRPLQVAEYIPFYCYIICDITPKLRVAAENATLTETPDRRGFFGYNPRLGTYVELISFDKLIDDAGKRNRVLFEKLNLPRA